MVFTHTFSKLNTGICSPGLRSYNTDTLPAKKKKLKPNRPKDYKHWGRGENIKAREKGMDMTL